MENESLEKIINLELSFKLTLHSISLAVKIILKAFLFFAWKVSNSYHLSIGN